MYRNLLTAFLLFMMAGLYGHSVMAQGKTTRKTTTSKTKTRTKPVKKTTTRPQTAIAIPYIQGVTRVKIETTFGNMVVRLYDETPLHRDNFIKLVQEGFYDGLLFHRTIGGFMIQGGDPMSRNAAEGTMLGMGGGDMTRISAEFNPAIFHKKGALAAARDNNPTKASSACQFYIVQGKPEDDNMLNMIQQQKGITYSEGQRYVYKTLGGTPFLDMDYTVFGEVESGLEVIDAINKQATDGNNRPKQNISMKITLLPMDMKGIE